MTGNATVSELPDIAIIGLEEGLDSTSLCILAGLNKYENSYQVVAYFEDALQELDMKLPDKRQAAIEFGVAIADEILKNKIDLIVGTKQIIEKAFGNYDFYSETKDFCFDSIGFDKVFGFYHTYDDLKDAYEPWNVGMTNAELIKKVKKELLDELEKWAYKYKSDSI